MVLAIVLTVYDDDEDDDVSEAALATGQTDAPTDGRTDRSIVLCPLP